MKHGVYLKTSPAQSVLAFSHLFQVVTREMKEFMKKLRKKVVVALVGGSDFPKLEEQMGGDNGKFSKLQELRLILKLK